MPALNTKQNNSNSGLRSLLRAINKPWKILENPLVGNIIKSYQRELKVSDPNVVVKKNRMMAKNKPKSRNQPKSRLPRYSLMAAEVQHLLKLMRNAYFSTNNRGIASGTPGELQLGVTSRFKTLTNATKKHRELFAVLAKFITDRLPSVKFSTIQINKLSDGDGMKMHTDKKNIGMSHCLSIGDFRKGTLVTFDKNGTIQEIDSHNQIQMFDATLPHQPQPFKGRDRYSIIWYTMYTKNKTLKQGDTKILRNIEKQYDCNLPWQLMTKEDHYSSRFDKNLQKRMSISESMDKDEAIADVTKYASLLTSRS